MYTYICINIINIYILMYAHVTHAHTHTHCFFETGSHFIALSGLELTM